MGNQPVCSKCSEPAVFITPQGLLCPAHALAAAEQEDPDEPEWLPLPIKFGSVDDLTVEVDLTAEDEKAEI